LEGRRSMQPRSHARRRPRRTAAPWLTAAAVLAAGLPGCASFYDEVTSRDFSVGQLFRRKDPLYVLRDNDDGNERHKALAALREPTQNGGPAKDQDATLEILKASATADNQPLCRMAAVRALGRFKDPRAAEILETVYLQPLTFGREISGLIHKECLIALG